MVFFGYQRNDERLLELEEVSLQCNLEELEELIVFLNEVKKEHSAVKNETGMCHSHFKDWKSKWNKEDTDFIVVTGCSTEHPAKHPTDLQ